MLHSNLPPKSYANMEGWWRGGGQCKQPHSIDWSRPRKVERKTLNQLL